VRAVHIPVQWCSAPAPAGGSPIGVITRRRHLRQLVVHQPEVAGDDVVIVLEIGTLLVRLRLRGRVGVRCRARVAVRWS
jgi:hypothetical protein